jgi:hypothetical protein
MRREAVGAGLVLGAAVLGYEGWGKGWQRRWGSTVEEVALELPGDELVAEPAVQVTRAVSIDAPPHAVWPWLVQIGADRAGFYSYDVLENLFGLGIHSADTIVEDWQGLAVGDVIAANRARTGGWYVVALVPGETLVLKVADLRAGRPVQRDDQLGWEFLWTFALRPGPDGGTRLLVRERTAFSKPLTRWAMAPLDLVSCGRTRGMVLGIRARADRIGSPQRPRASASSLSTSSSPRRRADSE